MKKFVLLISVAAMALFASSKVSAQGKYGPDSTECIKYLSDCQRFQENAGLGVSQ